MGLGGCGGCSSGNGDDEDSAGESAGLGQKQPLGPDAMAEGHDRSTGLLGYPCIRRSPHPDLGALPAIRRLLRGRGFRAVRIFARTAMRLLCQDPWGLPLLLDRQAYLQKF